MLYLGTSPCEPAVRDLLNSRRLGLMCQPASNPPLAGWLWAADNGCFAAKWDESRWRTWLALDHPRSGCLFAVVPDVVANHDATLARFHLHVDFVRGLRYPVAFVAQDGATPDTIPWADLDCLFVGGSTEWKLSEAAFRIARRARAEGKWVHVGRVNSLRRMRSWRDDADSCDGTYLAFGPKTNAPKLLGWIDDLWVEPSLLDGR